MKQLNVDLLPKGILWNYERDIKAAQAIFAKRAKEKEKEDEVEVKWPWRRGTYHGDSSRWDIL